MNELQPILQAILEELQRIRHRLGTSRLSHRDHVVLGKLLPAIAGRYGDGTWTVRELLADPVFAALLPSSNGNAAQALGQLFFRAIAEDIDGLTIDRLKLERGSALWALRRSQ
jgi:hypothetical protein